MGGGQNSLDATQWFPGVLGGQMSSPFISSQGSSHILLHVIPDVIHGGHSK